MKKAVLFEQRVFGLCMSLFFSLLFISQATAQYAGLPYFTGFEDNTLDANWTTASEDPLGRIQIYSTANFPSAQPFSGEYFLGMDTGEPGGVFQTNTADVGVDLSGEDNVMLSFKWMEWNDETQAEDGLFFSDNGGSSFVKVLDFDASAITDLTWQEVDLNITDLAGSNGLDLTSTFIIRFQQRDNFYFNGGNDGIFIDNISVTSNTCQVSSPVTNDVDVCGGGSASLMATGLGQINWYDSPIGNPISIGSTFEIPELESTTTYYVSSSSQVNLSWDFATDLEDWSPLTQCDLTASNWVYASDGGNGAAYAEDVSTNSSKLLRSRIIDVSNASSVDLNYNHRYNTETCCDHGYVVYRLNGGAWQQFTPTTGAYNIFDFMYNDPISGACGNSPDLNVYAGDNGGYETNGGVIDVLGANTLEVAFLFTSDASFGDDGWYINSVSMDINCESPRQAVTALVLPLQASPTVMDATACEGSSATLVVSSNTSNPSPVFNWFSEPNGGSSINSGSTFTVNPPSTTTYWVEEIAGGNQLDQQWDFDADPEGWQLQTQCSLTQNWAWNDDGGAGTIYATNPNNGNSSMLAISPAMNIGGVDEVTLAYKHRFNTETCCDHGYVVYRLDGGAWTVFQPDAGEYNIFDFMYNDPILGGCGFSPDTNVYAGDSEGYITSSGVIANSGASTLEVAFLYTTDASFRDDGWYIDQVRVVSTSSCPSARVPATAYVNDQPDAPTVSDLDICPGSTVILNATSNSSNTDPVFEWYDAAVGGNLLFRGNPFILQPATPYTTYVTELGQADREWDFDDGFEGWNTTGQCGFSATWEPVDDAGETALFAQQDGSGNSSMLLRSPLIQVEGSSVIDFEFDHRYNTETCCDHGYVIYRLDSGAWQIFEPTTNDYNVVDFMYNDPFFGGCGFSPDTSVFAGDSEGYLTSSGAIDVDGANTLEVAFFYSSDASFVDEGWYINRVALNGISLRDCASDRVAVNVNSPVLSAPTTTNDAVCPPQLGTLTATSNSGTVSPSFEWYANPTGGSPLSTGAAFTPPSTPLATTTYYVREVIPGDNIWSFDGSLEGWQAITSCGLTSNWQTVDDNGTGAAYAQQTGSGNSSMSLRSPAIDISGDEDEVLFTYRHRYNTETCCDHGYVMYRLDGGAWQFFEPSEGDYNIVDFMYNDPYFGDCGFSPDTSVYAGDSDGYITSSGSIPTSGANALELQFFYSSDASFVDDGWYIDEVSISALTTSCVSSRTPATLTITSDIEDPTVSDAAVCPGLDVDLLATSNSGLEEPIFNWYDAPSSGALLFIGESFNVNPPSTTTYYVEEVTDGDAVWTFDTGLDGWNATEPCGIEGSWVQVDDNGTGAVFARQNGSGNSSMFLSSPVIPLSGQFSISYSFNHRYNTETCCDHGYVVARRDGGPWFRLNPTTNGYNIFDFMYNDPFFGDCGFSPDIDVFAGDNGGYETSSGTLFVSGFSTVEFGFFFSSDASFVDEGWYINDFRVPNVYTGCSSNRVPVTVTVEDLTAPTTTNDITCIGGSGMLTATSNSNVLNTNFAWYDAESGGNLLGVGASFNTPPVAVNTSFWAEEIVQEFVDLTDDFNDGTESFWGLIAGGVTDSVCGSVEGNALRFNGAGVRQARTNQLDVTNGGSLSFDLKISNEVTAGCEAAESGEDVVLEYSIGGPYNIIQTFDEADYPDFTSIEVDIPVGAQSANTIFRLRQLSNSGTDFDVWAIDNFSIDAESVNICQSLRSEAQVTVEPLVSPSGTGDDICPGEIAVLQATSNSVYPNPIFDWYTTSVGGSFLGTGAAFEIAPVVTTTYFVEERHRGDRTWTFDNNSEDWIITAECGLTDIWEWADDGGTGTIFASNPFGGNTSMLATSPIMSVGGAEDVNLAFNHRYNTETCCDHGYVVYRLDGGDWQVFSPTTNPYNIFDFMYNDPIMGDCGFSPDMDVFAGDNGGYQLSSGTIEIDGAEALEVAFLFTSDASFTDEGWYIDFVSITGLGNGCVSDRSPVTVTVGDPSPPAPLTEDICLGGQATLLATATSGNVDPVFEWYDEPAGQLLATDNPYTTTQLFADTSFWVREIVQPMSYSLNDDFNSGFDPAIWSNVQAGTTDAVCGALSGNALRFNGSGTRLAVTNLLDVANGGTLNFNLKISNEATAGCEAAEPGEDVVLEYSFGGAYTIIDTFDQDSYPSFTNVTVEIPEAAQTANTRFRLRQLSNSGLDFDVWAIDNFNISATPGPLCSSTYTEVLVNTTPLPGPTVADVELCGPGPVSFTAVSNTGIPAPQVEWYSDATGGGPIFIGNPFEFNATDTITYYVQEVDPIGGSWTFDSDEEGWSLEAQCALSRNWEWASDGGEGALFGGNPTGGNTSMLAISPQVEVVGAGSVDLTYEHRYNTETCCDHGYVVYRLDGGEWVVFQPDQGGYNIFDFMYNDPILGDCGFSPDTNVYAGDSDGYITSGGSINTGGASSLEVAFLFTSDASFTDDGWYINSVEITMAGSGCISERVPARVIFDETPPEVTCPADITVGVDAGICSTAVNYTATATDNCSATISYAPSSGSNFNVGSTLVTATATDEASNSANCTFSVIVEDNELPTASCQDITVSLDGAGTISVMAGQIDSGSGDNCSVDNLSLAPNAFNCGDRGPNNVTLTVTDVNGNSNSCNAVVTITDDLNVCASDPPVAICQDITVVADAACQGKANAGNFDNGSFDPNGGGPLVFSVDPTGPYDLGQTNVVLTVTATSGLMGSCTASVTVVDEDAPTASCQDVTASLNASGSTSVTAGDVDAGSTDNCGIASLVVNPSVFDCDDIGIQEVWLVVTDNAGNSDSCQANVQVNGVLPEVSLKAGGKPEFCQGNEILIVSDAEGAASYLWSTGETTPEIVVSDAGTYTLTVTSSTNCSSSASITVGGSEAGSSLSAYTIYATGRVVVLKNNSQVLTGGVGVQAEDGLARVLLNSQVDDFVKAPSLITDGSSSVSTTINDPAMVALPEFKANTFNNTNDILVTPTENNVLTGCNYGNIFMKDNSTVTFTCSTVYIKSLTTATNVTINFAGTEELIVKRGMSFVEAVSFNPDADFVKVFTKQKVVIPKGSEVNARLYSQGNLLVSGSSSQPVSMNGLFIARKIASRNNVVWNWDLNCSSLVPPPQTRNSDASDLVHSQTIDFKAYPNPFLDEVVIEFELSQSADTYLEILGLNGQQVFLYDFGWLDKRELHQHRFHATDGLSAGTYIFRIVSGEEVVTGKLIRLR